MSIVWSALRYTAAGVIALTALGGTAQAGALTEAGIQSGAGWAGPIPEGVYFTNLLNAGGWPAEPGDHGTAGVEVPVITWASPYVLFGGQFILSGAYPMAYVAADFTNPTGPLYENVHANTGILPELAWKLGGGWAANETLVFWLPAQGFGYNEMVYESRTGISYSNSGWTARATFTYGYTGNNVQTGKKDNPDYFLIDSSIRKQIGKWTIGAVAFSGNDLNLVGSNLPTGKQSEVAVGGLVGYNFGPVSATFYLTKYVHETGLQSDATTIWSEIAVPLWEAPKLESLK